MIANCPICGRPLSPVETVLAEHDAGYQCRHCWNTMHAAAPVKARAAARHQKKSHVAVARRHLGRH